MGDVAQILGVVNQATGAQQAAAPAPRPAPAPKSLQSTAFPKPVLDVLSSSKSSDYNSAPLPPIVPSMVKVNNKFIQSSKKARPWCWAPFSSGARNDGLMLHHWVRAGVEYPEYPFVRFNIHLDGLSYKKENEDSDAFYKEFLHDDNWTQSETDTLLELCRIHELRWPVIIDRWTGKFGSLSNKNVEDLQHRYYTIGMILNRKLVMKAAKVEAENLAKALAASQAKSSVSNLAGDATADAKDRETLRAQHAVASAMSTSSSSAISSLVGNINANMQPSIAATNTGTTNQPTFDLETERQRRRILEKIWQRSKEEELEEESLRAELKLVEVQIRKLKKSGGHILAAAAAGGVAAVGGGSSLPTPASSRGPSPVPGAVAAAGLADASFAMLDVQFASTAPIPTPGTPYLQSGRLINPATGGQMAINKTTLKRMEQVLKELKVMERPTPTKRVCDMYDHVRKGALTLLTLQKVMLKKESEVVSRRNKLEKVAGAAVAREITAKAEAVANAVAKVNAAADKIKAKPKGGVVKTEGATKKATKKKAGTGETTATKRKSTSKKPTAKKPAGTAAVVVATATAGVAPPAAMPASDTDGPKPKKRAKKN